MKVASARQLACCLHCIAVRVVTMKITGAVAHSNDEDIEEIATTTCYTHLTFTMLLPSNTYAPNIAPNGFRVTIWLKEGVKRGAGHALCCAPVPSSPRVG